MAQASPKEIPTQPTWLDPVEPKGRGLDLLGLRLPVQIVGGSLLDGITTITPSVRNFSLRAWLIWSYGNARRPDDWATFREFAAHAEAAIALGNHLAESGAPGVVGIEEADRLAETGASEFALKPFASQIAMLAYANPSDQIGLTFSRDTGVPGLTRERGVELAKLVQGVLEDSKIGSAIARGETLGTVTREDLIEFGERVSLAAIGTQENRCLVDAILPANPRPGEVPRLTTFAMLLALADKFERPPKEADFFQEITAATSSLPAALVGYRDGWARYLIRDCLAVCHEAVLASVVSALDQLQADSASTVDREQVLAWLLEQSAREADSLRELGLELPAGEVSSWRFEDISVAVQDATQAERSSESLFSRWNGQLQEWPLQHLARTLGPGAPICLPVVWLLARRRADSAVRESPANTLGSRARWPRIGLSEVIVPKVAQFLAEDWTFIDAVRWLIQRTVDQHLRIAWSRLRAEQPPRDVAVLTSDGQRWCKRRSFGGGRTASRIAPSVSWLRQLGLLEEDGLTDSGRDVLARTVALLSAAQ